jgi:hypothetical protein
VIIRYEINRSCLSTNITRKKRKKEKEAVERNFGFTGQDVKI